MAEVLLSNGPCQLIAAPTERGVENTTRIHCLNGHGLFSNGPCRLITALTGLWVEYLATPFSLPEWLRFCFKRALSIDNGADRVVGRIPSDTAFIT
jgi:hypothetical protein